MLNKLSILSPTLDESAPMIGVLLCTYNGERYLYEQLCSIVNQTYKNWRIFVSYDGSTDKTIEIVKEIRKLCGEHLIHILEGPKLGPTKNFLSLVRLVQQECEYFAFCDQDDIWYEDKLALAVNSIKSLNNTLPALYCTSTNYISEDGRYLQKSYIFKRQPSFKNALVQSIAGGNTMVFNRSAGNLLAQTPEVDLISHDWWAYILISGSGGKIYYDSRPSLAYRQHSAALVGENRSIFAKIFRIRKLLDGSYKHWNNENLNALIPLRGCMTSDNQKTLIWFEKMRSRLLAERVYAFIRSGVRRQTLMGNIALFLGVILKKV